MPQSVVLYLSREAFEELRARLSSKFKESPVKAYTLSFPNKSTGDFVRVRVTELEPYATSLIVSELETAGRAIPASTADKDVRGASYEELLEGADRFARTAKVQFLSPTIVDLDGYPIPFPVIPLMFRRYIEVWNAFSPIKITGSRAWIAHLTIPGFAVSAVRTALGLAFEGWIELELGKGMTEEEIRTFNALLDFAFYCGTGMGTETGLGQTTRAGSRVLTGCSLTGCCATATQEPGSAKEQKSRREGHFTP